MGNRIIVIVFALLFALAMPSVSLGGQVFTTHPAGQGAQSRANWKASIGEPDAGGTGTQAMYMQKMNTSAAAGMGVVVIRGLSGQLVSALQGLSWERPTLPANGSYCGNSPHWQVSVTSGATTSTMGFGPCFSQLHSAGTTVGWTKDTCDSTCLSGLPIGSTINSLAIIFEDGTDMSPGFVILDNITVNSTIGNRTWTSASDNATASINIGATLALADEASDVLGDLLNLFPNVPITEWTLYPAVEVAPPVAAPVAAPKPTTPTVALGTAASFSILAGTPAITSTGATTIDKNVGIHPAAALTGFLPGTVGGTIHAADAVALQAKTDLTAAYLDAASRPATATHGALGGLTLVGGVYTAGGVILDLTGPLTLDGQGDPNSVWVFQATSSLITASASSVKLINGASPCNIFWQVTSSATLGSGSSFVGTILALTSITLADGVAVNGRALAQNGTVTLINDTFVTAPCS